VDSQTWNSLSCASGMDLRRKAACEICDPCYWPGVGDGDEDAKLSAAVGGSLEVADELKLTSISFPAISTGIFGFPKERAARVIFTATENYFSHRVSGIKLVRLVLFDSETIRAFMTVWSEKSDKSHRSDKSNKSEA